jgi:hypothetical protein
VLGKILKRVPAYLINADFPAPGEHPSQQLKYLVLVAFPYRQEVSIAESVCGEAIDL